MITQLPEAINIADGDLLYKYGTDGSKKVSASILKNYATSSNYSKTDSDARYIKVLGSDTKSGDFSINGNSNINGNQSISGNNAISGAVKIVKALGNIDAIPLPANIGGRLQLLNDTDKYGLMVGVDQYGVSWFQSQRTDNSTLYPIRINPNGGDIILQNANISKKISWTPVVVGDGQYGMSTTNNGSYYCDISPVLKYVEANIKITDMSLISGTPKIALPFTFTSIPYMPFSGYVISPGTNPRGGGKGEPETDSGGYIKFKKGYSTSWMQSGDFANGDFIVFKGLVFTG